MSTNKTFIFYKSENKWIQVAKGGNH